MFDELSLNRATLKRSLQRAFVVGNWRVALGLAVALAGGALVGGALVVLVHPVLALALPLALGAGVLMLRTPQWGLYGIVLVAILLPFAALPVSIGFKPTFLDGALAATFFVWFMTLLGGRSVRPRFAPFSPLVLLFMGIAFAAFVAGLEHAALDKQTLRRFLELLLGVALLFLVVDHVRRPQQLYGLATLILWAGFASALLGIALYLLPHPIANGLLNRLAVFDYPAGFVLRFILDDPANSQRAISTSVDPNVFGGMLILLGAFAAPQVAARHPLVPRWLALTMLGTMGLALVLTFSRGSMLGLLVALAPLMILRYRRLIPWVLLAGVLLLALPQAQAYLAHFLAGLRGEDLATQMRFGEYKDALRLIQRYPYFGVGFSGAPDIDLYIGVSSVYLLIAEQMGLLGLGAYLLVNLAFFLFVVGAIRQFARPPAGAATVEGRAEPLLLGLTSAILGALFAGIFDHHFFDMTFPHFATLYWLFMGLAVAAAHIGAEERAARVVPSPPTANPLLPLLEGAQG